MTDKVKFQSFIIAVVSAIAFRNIVRASAAVQTIDIPQKCTISIDGITIEKHIGDTWKTAEELCMKNICVLSSNGSALVKSYREECSVNCANDFELVKLPGQCCGKCVQTKCRYNVTSTIYDVGDMWKSADNCTFYECIRQKGSNDVAEILPYTKMCPPVASNCKLPNKIAYKDCCEYCDNSDSSDHINKNKLNKTDEMDYIYKPDKYKDIMDKEHYNHHPCVRECQSNVPAMVCNYTFVVEWYETLSKACYDCPYNKTDCSRPHCIYTDGLRRSVLVVNKMMPGPSIQVCLGDKIVVDVINNLMGESTTIHWHGMHMKSAPYMDGVPQISQCPIPPHSTFRYTYEADHGGTHWWHSHIGMQRSDGAFGSLIVREPQAKIPHRNLYNFDLSEHTMFVQDWDQRIGISSFNSFHHSLGNNKPKNVLINGKGKYFDNNYVNPLEHTATTGAEMPNGQVFRKLTEKDEDKYETVILSTTTEKVLTTDKLPIDDVHQGYTNLSEKDEEKYETTFLDSSIDSTTKLLNEKPGPSVIVSGRNKRDLTESSLTPLEIFEVQSNKSYRFRLINAGFLNCPLELSIDFHNITVIASDGYYFKPVEVSSLVSYAGERFDFIVNATQPIDNYWIRIRGLMDCDERNEKTHQEAILRYQHAKDAHPIGIPTYDYHREGVQMNALNRGSGENNLISIAELESIDEIHPKIRQKKADFQFYVYYDFYDRDNPHFNDPDLYAIDSMKDVANQFMSPQLNYITMKMPTEPLMVYKDKVDDAGFCNETLLRNEHVDCLDNFCECTHVLQVPLNATIEVILVDEGYKYDANHPFHLHGHGFRVMAMDRIRASGISVDEIKALDAAGKIHRNFETAPMKDTVTVPDGGYTIIRFISDNPGYWLFHCHIEFHVEVGMALVFKVGTTEQIPAVPKDFPRCSNYMPKMSGGTGDESAGGSGASQISWSIFVIFLSLVYA